MKQSHHIPPFRTPIEVVNPTLRRMSAKQRQRMANLLACGAALMAVVLSVSLSSAATDAVCSMPIDDMPVASCN
jgi:hypothetical protein